MKARFRLSHETPFYCLSFFIVIILVRILRNRIQGQGKASTKRNADIYAPVRLKYFKYLCKLYVKGNLDLPNLKYISFD